MKTQQDVTPYAPLSPLAQKILDLLKDEKDEDASDAMGVAFCHLVKDRFDVPRLGCDYAFVDTILQDKTLGAMHVRAVVLRQIPPVDRERKYATGEHEKPPETPAEGPKEGP